MAIPTRMDINAFRPTGVLTFGGGSQYIVESFNGAVYIFIIDLLSDPAFIKSVDGGLSFSSPTVLKNCSLSSLSVYYDRWTDPTGALGDKIWVAYLDSVSANVFIRSVDTANSDALGTEYTIFDGASRQGGGTLSISRMIGGNLICCGCIDAGVEVFSRKSTDAGANWSDIAGVQEAGGSGDLLICLPGWGADTQDAMIFYYDRSASEVSVKYYDDSANSVSEASLATSVSIPDHASFTYGHFAATVDHTNSANICVFWTAVDTANADLKCFSCTQAAQTAKTDVVLNSTDDQGFCSISISPTGSWEVSYYGKSDGTQTFNNAMLLYFKTSTDGGTTWGSETLLGDKILIIFHFYGIPIYYKRLMNVTIGHANSTPYNIYLNTKLAIPRTTYQLGI